MLNMTISFRSSLLFPSFLHPYYRPSQRECFYLPIRGFDVVMQYLSGMRQLPDVIFVSVVMATLLNGSIGGESPSFGARVC